MNTEELIVPKSIDVNLDDVKQLTLVSKALSSEVRIDIIKLLYVQDCNINEIAERLDLAPSSEIGRAHV